MQSSRACGVTIEKALYKQRPGRRQSFWLTQISRALHLCRSRLSRLLLHLLLGNKTRKKVLYTYGIKLKSMKFILLAIGQVHKNLHQQKHNYGIIYWFLNHKKAVNHTSTVQSNTLIQAVRPLEVHMWPSCAYNDHCDHMLYNLTWKTSYVCLLCDHYANVMEFI